MRKDPRLSESGKVLQNSVIANNGIFNRMHSLALFIVELQTAKRRLITIFEEPDGIQKADSERTECLKDNFSNFQTGSDLRLAKARTIACVKI